MYDSTTDQITSIDLPNLFTHAMLRKGTLISFLGYTESLDDGKIMCTDTVNILNTGTSTTLSLVDKFCKTTMTHTSQDTQVSFDGYTLVWIGYDDTTSEYSINTYDLATATKNQIVKDSLIKRMISVSGDIISWIDEISMLEQKYNVKRYTISTGLTEQKTIDLSAEDEYFQFSDLFAIQGEDIIWTATQANKIHGHPNYIVECDSRSQELLNKLTQSEFVIFADHGFQKGWGFQYPGSSYESEDIPNLPPLFSLSLACLTCDFQKSISEGEAENLMCANMIRKGATGYIGSIQSMQGHHYTDDFMSSVFQNKMTVGEALKAGKIKENNGDWTLQTSEDSNYPYGKYDFLLGDPTFKIRE